MMLPNEGHVIRTVMVVIREVNAIREVCTEIGFESRRCEEIAMEISRREDVVHIAGEEVEGERGWKGGGGDVRSLLLGLRHGEWDVWSGRG